MKHFTALLFSLILLLAPRILFAQKDSTSIKPKQIEHFGHQLRLNVDISRPIFNAIHPSNQSYELALDYYLKNEVYGVWEGGFGSSIYDYPDLSYTSTSKFFRVGVDKTLIKRMSNKDWDAAFMGIRYGLSIINRQEAKYQIADSIWGSSSGTIPAKIFAAHWVELTGGVKVEILKNLMAGWTFRTRILMNDRAFSDLSPIFIAGYGKGDKTTVFDFTFYLSYALRWGAIEEKKE